MTVSNRSYISPFSNFHDLTVQVDRKSKKQTPESLTLEGVTGAGATCCAMVSMDEAASSAMNPRDQSNTGSEHLHSEAIHIPEGAEIGLATTAGYLSVGGVLIADQIAKDHAIKQKKLEEAKTKVSAYQPDSSSSDINIAQDHAKAAFTKILGARIKRAAFERVVNGRMSQVNSALIATGQFIPMAQTAGLYGLSAGSFANAVESVLERKDSQAGRNRAKETHYSDFDDSLIRQNAFRKKSQILATNAFFWSLLGFGSGVNASIDVAMKAAPSGFGALPGVGTILGLPALLGGVVGTIVFNNKKNNDINGPALTHELIHAIELNDQGDVIQLPTHQEIRSLNLMAYEKKQAVNTFRKKVYQYRGRDISRGRLGRFLARTEHGAMRLGHKASVLLTLGLIPKITGMKDQIRDHVLRHNKGHVIEQSRISALAKLKGKEPLSGKILDYSEKTSTEKLKYLLEAVRSTPEVSELIQKKFLARIASVDSKNGTYQVSQGEGENEELASHSYLKINPSFKSKIFKHDHFIANRNEAIVHELLRSEAELLLTSKILDYLKSSVLLKTKKDSFASIMTDQDKQSIAECLKKNELYKLQKLLKKYRLSFTKLGRQVLRNNFTRAEKRVDSSEIRVKVLQKISAVRIVRNAVKQQGIRLQRAAEHLKQGQQTDAVNKIGEKLSNIKTETLKNVGKEFEKIGTSDASERNILKLYKSLGMKRFDALSSAIYHQQYACAAKELVNGEMRNFFRDQIIAGNKAPDAFRLAEKLASRYKDEQFSAALLEELYIAIDHVLIFSAHKDSQREMMVYSELSDAFVATKQNFDYSEEVQQTQRSNVRTPPAPRKTLSRSSSNLCADPGCMTSHKPLFVPFVNPLKTSAVQPQLFLPRSTANTNSFSPSSKEEVTASRQKDPETISNKEKKPFLDQVLSNLAYHDQKMLDYLSQEFERFDSVAADSRNQYGFTYLKKLMKADSRAKNYKNVARLAKVAKKLETQQKTGQVVSFQDFKEQLKTQYVQIFLEEKGWEYDEQNEKFYLTI